MIFQPNSEAEVVDYGAHKFSIQKNTQYSTTHKFFTVIVVVLLETGLDSGLLHQRRDALGERANADIHGARVAAQRGVRLYKSDDVKCSQWSCLSRERILLAALLNYKRTFSKFSMRLK